MSAQRSWHANGFVQFRGTPSQLAEALVLAGLRASAGRYAVTISGCSQFVLRCVDNPDSASVYELDADADSAAEMVEAATLVSGRLLAASIDHTFEVYSPANELVKAITHNG